MALPPLTQHWNQNTSPTESAPPSIPYRPLPDLAKTPPPQPTDRGVLQIEHFDARTVIIRGKTYPHRTELARLGGAYNGVAMGWFFRKDREAEIRQALGQLVAETQPGPAPAKAEPSGHTLLTPAPLPTFPTNLGQEVHASPAPVPPPPPNNDVAPPPTPFGPNTPLVAPVILPPNIPAVEKNPVVQELPPPREPILNHPGLKADGCATSTIPSVVPDHRGPDYSVPFPIMDIPSPARPGC